MTMTEEQTATADGVNLGSALEIIKRFVDDYAQSGGEQTTEYVAAKLAIDRLTQN